VQESTAGVTSYHQLGIEEGCAENEQEDLGEWTNIVESWWIEVVKTDSQICDQSLQMN
jgi:hypothetical protein